MYGLSLWLLLDSIPQEVQELIKKHNHKSHLPHITVKTNIHSLAELRELYNKYNIKKHQVRIVGKAEVFPIMYEQDPLHAWGTYAQVDLDTQSSAHLTIAYSEQEIKKAPVISFDFITSATLQMVDTRSIRPWEWFPITDQTYTSSFPVE